MQSEDKKRLYIRYRNWNYIISLFLLNLKMIVNFYKLAFHPTRQGFFNKKPLFGSFLYFVYKAVEYCTTSKFTGPMGKVNALYNIKLAFLSPLCGLTQLIVIVCGFLLDDKLAILNGILLSM